MENSEELVTSDITEAPTTSGEPPVDPTETEFEDAPESTAPTSSRSRLPEPVFFADRLLSRRRRRADLYEAIMCLVGIVLVWGLGFVASSTTEGVAQDVLRVTVIRDLLLMPLSLLEGLTILVTPIAVIGMLLFRRQVSTAIEALATSMIAGVASYVTSCNHHRPAQGHERGERTDGLAHRDQPGRNRSHCPLHSCG